MARAICSVCGHEQRWSARRGRRLADVRCEKCGGELRGMTAGRPGVGIGAKSFRMKFEAAPYARREGHRINRPRVWYFADKDALRDCVRQYQANGRLVAVERRDPETRKWVAYDLSAPGVLIERTTVTARESVSA